MTVVFNNRNITLKNVRTNIEIVMWMRERELYNIGDLYDFMYEYASRKQLFENINIRYTCVDSFVDDLLQYKIITIYDTSHKKLFNCITYLFAKRCNAVNTKYIMNHNLNLKQKMMKKHKCICMNCTSEH